jgi:hypothetical protein
MNRAKCFTNYSKQYSCELIFKNEHTLLLCVWLGRRGEGGIKSTMSFTECEPGSLVGTATELRAGRYGDRIPVEARFSAPVQTGLGAHPASCTMGTGYFLGVNSGRGGTLTPQPLLVLWSWKSRAIPLLTLWVYGLYRASVPVQACTLPLPFTE